MMSFVVDHVTVVQCICFLGVADNKVDIQSIVLIIDLHQI